MMGKQIVGVRNLTLHERTLEGWARNAQDAVALELDDGTLLYASCDEEGNAPGSLFGRSPNGETFIIVAREGLQA